MADLAHLDLTPLTAPLTDAQVAAYREPREVDDFSLRRSYENQIDSRVRPGCLWKGSVITFGLACCVVGAIGFLAALAELVVGGAVASSCVGVVVSGLVVWLGVAVLRSLRGEHPTWRGRYRFDAFARANGFTYVYRADPAPVPVQWRGDVENRTFTDVLRTTSGQPVTVGRLRQYDGSYNPVGNPPAYSVVALGLGVTVPPVALRHRRRVREGTADALRAHFDIGDGSSWHQAGRYLTPEVVAAILQTAPGFDVELSGDTLFLLRRDVVGDRNVKALGESLRIAATVGPLVARAAARVR